MNEGYHNGASGNPGVPSNSTSTFFTPQQYSEPFSQQFVTSASQDVPWPSPDGQGTLTFPCENCFKSGVKCDLKSPCGWCRRDKLSSCPHGTGITAKNMLSPFDMSFRTQVYHYVKKAANESAAASKKADLLQGYVVMLRQMLVQKTSYDTPRVSVPQKDMQHVAETSTLNLGSSDEAKQTLEGGFRGF